MGNKIGGRRKAGVEDRYTRPQGLYEHRDIDQKKLRKLILEAKLAPCFPGADEASGELEECPICFLNYPSLNRSKCCSKGICTECFLQMKPTHTTQPTQCPFCKTPNYAVEYRGVKTEEERSIEQFEEQKVIEAQLRMQQQAQEEQKVIEAQLRMRQQALKDEEAKAKLKRKQRRCSSSRTVAPTTEVEYRDICSTSFSVPSYQCTEQGTECCSSEPSCSAQASMRPFHSRHHRDDNVDMNLEEMMVMEAIWRSVQEQGNLGNPVCGSYFPVMEAPSRERQAYLPAASLEIPHPGGYSCAVAALAEHQPPSMDFSYMVGSSSTFPVFDTIRRPCNMSGGSMCAMENSSLNSWSGIASSFSREVVREEGECSTDHWSEGVEAGTSYAGSDIVADPATMQPLPFPENFAMAPGHFRPESIDEQMMFSMAVSHHGRAHAQGLAWL